MPLMPIDGDLLTEAEYDRELDRFETILCDYNALCELNSDDGLAFIYPDDPEYTSIAVNTLDQLIDVSVYLAQRGILLYGVAGHDQATNEYTYSYYPAGVIEERERYEFMVYNYGAHSAEKGAQFIHPDLQQIIDYATSQGIRNYRSDGQQHFSAISHSQTMQIIDMAIMIPFCRVSCELYSSEALYPASYLIKIDHAIGE